MSFSVILNLTGSMSVMDPELDRIAATRLRAVGQRFTTNRRELVTVLAEADAPLTIPELLERRRGLAQSSVYRNLSIMEQAGVVTRIVTSDEWARFELAHDLTEHHHHMICSSCGSVADITLPAEVEQAIDNSFTKIARKKGFHLDHHRLDLVGTCSSCHSR